jgi:hypothetical protein
MAENQYPLYYGIGADNSEFLKAFEEMHRILETTAKMTDTRAKQMVKSLAEIETKSNSVTETMTQMHQKGEVDADKYTSTLTRMLTAEKDLVAQQERLRINYEKQQQLLKTLEESYESIERQLREMSSSGDVSSDQYDALSQSLSQIKSEIESTKGSLDTAGQAYAEYSSKARSAIDEARSAQERYKAEVLDSSAQESVALTKVATTHREVEAASESSYSKGISRSKEQVAASKAEKAEIEKVQNAKYESYITTKQITELQAMNARDIISAYVNQRVAVKALETEVRNGNIARQEELNSERELLSTIERLTFEKNKAMTMQRELIDLLFKENQQTKEATAYKQELEKVVKEVGTAYLEATKTQTLLSKGGSGMAGVMSGLQGIMGVFTSAQGVMALFAKSNEDLIKIQTRLQSVMAITMGLQQISNTLHATSEFRVKTVTSVTRFFTKANYGLATSLGISNAAAKALMATLTLGLSVVITGLISAVSALVSKQREHAEMMRLEAEKQKEYAKSVAESASKQTLIYKQLQAEWKSLKTEYEKNRFIDYNKTEFDKLGVAITSVSEAENLLVANERTFINTIRQRAIAAASMELAAEKYKLAIEKMIEADSYQASKDDIREAQRISSKNIDTQVGKASNPLLRGQIGSAANRQAEFEKVLKDIIRQRTKVLDSAAKEYEKQGDEFISTANKINNDQINALLGVGIKPKTDSSTGQINEAIRERLKQQMAMLEEHSQWLAQSTRKANDELIDLELDYQKSQIKYMQEGTAKRKAQTEVEQKESIVAMQRYVRNLLDEQAKLAINEGVKVDYGSFEIGADGMLAFKMAEDALQLTPAQWAVIQEMIRQFNQKIVDEWVDSEVKSGEQMADELLDQMDGKLKEGTSKGAFNALKEQASLIFADISELSSEMIRQIISNAEKYIASGKVSDEALAQYRQAIDRANEYLVDKNPWDALKLAQERYAKAIKDYNDAQGQTDPEKRIKAQNQAILDQAAALAIIRQAYEEIANIINDVVGVFGEFAKAAGIDENVASSVENLIGKFSTLLIESGLLAKALIKVAEASGEAGKAFADAAKEIGDGTSTAGIIGAMIGAYSAIVQVIQAVESAKEAAVSAAADEYLDRINSQLDKLHEKLEKIASFSDLSRSWFGADTIADIKDIYNAFAYQENVLDRLFNNVISKYKATYDSYMKLWTKFLKEGKLSKKEQRQMGDFSFGAEIYDQFSKIQKALGEAGFNLEGGFNLVDVVSIQEQISALEELYSFLQKGGDELAELAGDVLLTKEALELYVEYYDKLKESVESLVGDISGNTLSTVNSMWKEIRKGGETTFEDLAEAAKKNTSEVIDQMVSKQLWATYMSGYFDQLGEGLTNAIIQGGDTGALMDVFDDFWSGMEQGLIDYTSAYETFLQLAEQRGWDMGTGKADASAPEGSIKAMREELAKLQEQWNNLTAEEREGDLGKQLFGDIEDLKEKIQLAEDLYNTKSIETLIQQQERLNALYQEWVEMYGQETADEMLAGLGATPDDYIKALEARRDELQALDELTAEQQEELTEVLSKINSIYDAAHNAAAEVSQEAYNAWSDALSDSLSNAASDYERLAAYQAAYLIALNDSVMGEEERARALEESSKNAEELKKQITANLRETYRTDEEQREIDLSTFKADLEWANSQGLPDLAKNIQDAWNAYLLEDWEKGFEDSLDGYDTYLEKYKEIIKSLTELDETSPEGAAQYLLDKKAELERKMQSELYDKYKTDEQEYLDKLKDYENDIAEALAIGNTELAAEAARQRDEYISDYLAEIMESTEGWEALMGELSEMTREEAEAAIEEARKYLNETEGLSEEYKQEQLAKLREIEKQLDDLDFENLIESAKEVLEVFDSLIGVLEAMGADTQVIDNLREVSSLASSIVSAVSSFASGNIVGGIVSVIGAITSGISLINQLMDPYARKIAEATAEVERQERAYSRLQKAIANTLNKSDVAEKKAQAIAVQQSIIAALQEQLKDEQEKKQSWWDPLGWFTSGPDEEKIANLTDAINDAYAEINAIVESMVDDFYGQDVDSIVSKYADVLSTPFDNAIEKAQALRAASKEIIKQMVLDWAKAQLLSPEIKSVLNGYYADNKDKAFTKESLNGLMEDLESATSGFSSFIESLQDVWGTEDVDSSATSAIKSITQPQANELLGIATGMRIIQNEMKNDQKTMGQEMADIARLNAEMLEVVRDIRDNTGDIRDNTVDIKVTLSRMSNNNSLYGTGLNV